jgi:twitching motility protein PilT
MAEPTVPTVPQSNPQTTPQFQPRPATKPAPKKSVQELHLDELLELIIAKKGSDLHLASGIPPCIRVDGALEPTNYENMNPLDIQQIMYAILTDEQIQKFESIWELDFSYALGTKAASPLLCVSFRPKYRLSKI